MFRGSMHLSDVPGKHASMKTGVMEKLDVMLKTIRSAHLERIDL